MKVRLEDECECCVLISWNVSMLLSVMAGVMFSSFDLCLKGIYYAFLSLLTYK